MHQLNSNNYETILVITRDETITMPADKGTKLMQYLTSDNPSSHVMVTDIQGVQVVLNKNDIRKITPKTKSPQLKSAEELGMTTDNRSANGDGFAKFQEMKRKMLK